MKQVITIVVICSCAVAQEPKKFDKTFWIAATPALGITALDAVTTGGAYNRWKAAQSGSYKMYPCIRETSQPWLYGPHPDMSKAITIGLGKAVIFAGSSWLLRKHHSRFWALPLSGMYAASYDAINNAATCY
jgi:hypothetical protein